MSILSSYHQRNTAILHERGEREEGRNILCLTQTVAVLKRRLCDYHRYLISGGQVYVSSCLD